MVEMVEDELVCLRCELNHFAGLTISSTVAAYSRIPAEIESRIPLAIEADADVMDYTSARTHGCNSRSSPSCLDR